MPGGITNVTYGYDHDGDRFLVRVFGAGTELLGIDREVHVHNARLAHEHGIGAAVIHADAEGMVCRAAPGRTLSSGSAASPGVLARVAEALRSCHGVPVSQVRGVYSVFADVTGNIGRAGLMGVALPDDADRLATVAGSVDAALRTAPVPAAFCHGDAVPDNMIDDGERVFLIDWEYAGVGDPFFDLGMVAAYHDLGQEQSAELLRACRGTVDRAGLARTELMRTMSDLRDVAWSLVQQAISELPFDFVAYRKQRLIRLRERIAGPAHEAWLDDAGAGGGCR